MLESSKMCPQKLREVIVWSESGNDDLVLTFEALCAGVLAAAPQIGGASFLASYCVGNLCRNLSKKVGKEPAQLDSARTGEGNGAARCEA